MTPDHGPGRTLFSRFPWWKRFPLWTIVSAFVVAVGLGVTVVSARQAFNETMQILKSDHEESDQELESVQQQFLMVIGFSGTMIAAGLAAVLFTGFSSYITGLKQDQLCGHSALPAEPYYVWCEWVARVASLALVALVGWTIVLLCVCAQWLSDAQALIQAAKPIIDSYETTSKALLTALNDSGFSNPELIVDTMEESWANEIVLLARNSAHATFTAGMVGLANSFNLPYGVLENVVNSTTGFCPGVVCVQRTGLGILGSLLRYSCMCRISVIIDWHAAAASVSDSLWTAAKAGLCTILGLVALAILAAVHSTQFATRRAAVFRGEFDRFAYTRTDSVEKHSAYTSQGGA